MDNWSYYFLIIVVLDSFFDVNTFTNHPTALYSYDSLASVSSVTFFKGLRSMYIDVSFVCPIWRRVITACSFLDIFLPSLLPFISFFLIIFNSVC